jgi:hypothetical protein
MSRNTPYEVAICHSQKIWLSSIIGVSGKSPTEEDLDEFFKFIDKTKSKPAKLSSMDMWKAFRNSTLNNAPGALTIDDKFHIMSHSPKALKKLLADNIAGKYNLSAQGYIWATVG